MVKQRIGSRAQVMHGTAKMTGGGLTKKHLKYNKRGKIVSKKASKSAKKSNNLVKAGYITRKGHFGTIRRGGGSAVLAKAVSKFGRIKKYFENGFKPGRNTMENVKELFEYFGIDTKGLERKNIRVVRSILDRKLMEIHGNIDPRLSNNKYYNELLRRDIRGKLHEAYMEIMNI